MGAKDVEIAETAETSYRLDGMACPLLNETGCSQREDPQRILLRPTFLDGDLVAVDDRLEIPELNFGRWVAEKICFATGSHQVRCMDIELKRRIPS